MEGGGFSPRQQTPPSPAIPYGGPGVLPLQAASGVGDGEGFAANSHRYAPSGFLPAIRYLVEELGADGNAVDHEGNTTVDMANGPVQRTQPYPDTIALLEKLGAKNNHKCITC